MAVALGVSRLARHRGKLLLSLVVMVLFGWLFAAGSLPVIPPVESFHRVEPWAVALYAVLWITILLVRSVRWHWLLAPIHAVPLRKILTVSLIGYGATLVLPFRTGEIVRPALIRQKGQLSAWAATGTVGAERVIDGLCLSVLLLIALHVAEPVAPLPDRIGDLAVPVRLIPGAARAAVLLFLAGFVVILVFFWARLWARRATLAVLGPLSMKLATRLADAVERVADGLRFLPQLRYTGPFLALTLIYWLLYFGATWMLLEGTGLGRAGFAESAVIMGVLALGIMVPSAPGFFGTFQISLYAGLALYFDEGTVLSEGSAFVFLLYALQIPLTVGAGVVALLLEHMSLGTVLATDLE